MKKYLTFNPHIIISDVRMPIMNGLEFLKAVRQTNNQTILFFLSGNANLQDTKGIEELALAGIFVKPIIDIDGFLQAIKTACEKIN